MSRFFYKAKKGPTEIVEGDIEAENEDAAIGKISNLGLVPIRVSEMGQKAVSAPPSAVSKKKTEAVPAPASNLKIDKDKVRIPYKDLNIFIRQFAIMMRASVPLLRIFEILKVQTAHAKFRKVLEEIQEQLRGGDSLSAVLSRYPKIFSQLFVSMVQAGEVSGTLDKVLMRLAEFSEQEAEIRSKVKSAMIYPLFLLLAGIATVFILLTFVMPRLMSLFSDLGTQLPTITQILLRISHFCQSYWIVMLGAVLAFVIWLRSAGLSASQKKAIDRMILKLPLIGRLAEKAETARFLRSLELLYEGGIPLFQAVAVAGKTISNSVMREEMEKVPARLEGGSTLAKSLEEVPYLTAFVTNMVSVGEESGQLTVAVRETAAFYESETNQFIKIATALIEPIMILGIGIVIGFIIIAMLLPIFDISTSAH